MSQPAHTWEAGSIKTDRANGNYIDEPGELYGPLGLHAEGGRWRLTELGSGRVVKSFPFDGMATEYEQEQRARRCAVAIAFRVEMLVKAKQDLRDVLASFMKEEEDSNE